MLRFTSAEWQAFVDGVKDGEFSIGIRSIARRFA